MELTGIEDTGWVTIYSRYLESKKKKSFLKDRFSEWFIEENGTPDFVHQLRKATLLGVPARSATFDELIKKGLIRAKIGKYQVDYWALGCGFDSRWERFNHEIGKTIREYREFDFQNLLEHKKTIISNSPFEEMYSKVKHSGGDLLKGLPGSIPETDMPTFIVLEGVIDYFEKKDRMKLLGVIKERVFKAICFIDLQSAFLVQRSNKKSERCTGSHSIKFAWGPDNINDFFIEQGWKVEKSVFLIKEMFKKNKMLLRFVPLPKKILECWKLVKITPGT